MKKLILLLLFIPLVSSGQNEKNNQKKTSSSFENVVITASKQKIKRTKTDDINLSKNESAEMYNPFLNCDINNNNCFQNLINNHISDNFHYPQLAAYFDIQAMVNVNYTIDKNGLVKNVNSSAALIGVAFEDVDSKKIISDAFEKAANSIIESLPKINPSIVDGVAVDKKFRTPILYRLDDIEKGPMISININKINEGNVFLNNLDNNEFQFSEVPVFPGCEDVIESKKRSCFQTQIQKHINKNFKYPETAQKEGIQGRVFVKFIVGKDGNIMGLEARGPYLILEKEAIRIISLLPKIKPGEIEGRKVRVPFSIPITFGLQ